MNDPDMLSHYLSAGQFVDSGHPAVIHFTKATVTGHHSVREKAVALYYAVRDGIRYTPYACSLDPASVRASAVLEAGQGFCVGKAVLLAACSRVVGIPSRLGFADVRNHLSTPKLLEVMGTDIFHYHGFTELWIDDRWLKATPVFNLELCERFSVLPLEFDGIKDSVFQQFDNRGQNHMEYLAYHEPAADVPLQRVLACYRERYPKLLKMKENEDPSKTDLSWDTVKR